MSAAKKNVIRLSAVGFLCLLLFQFPLVSFSAELLMVTIEHPPNSFTKNGEVTGASTEMLRYILPRMGYTPEFRSLPAKRALEMIEHGDAHGIYTYTQTSERLNAAYFSNPVAFINTFFFKRKGDDIQWKTFSDLQRYKIGANAGYNYSKEFVEAAEKGVFSVDYIFGENASFQNLKKLKAGRIDLFVCNYDVCSFIIKTCVPEFDLIDYIDKPTGQLKSFHVGFSKKVPNARQIRDEFNRQLDEIIANGHLKQIYDKYSMSPDYERLGSKGRDFLDPNAE